MNRSQYMQYISEMAMGQRQASFGQLLLNLQAGLNEIKANRKYYPYEWYFDSLENYRKVAKEAYRTIAYNAEKIAVSIEKQIADVEARVFNPKGDSQDDINAVNSLVVRITAEIKTNPGGAIDILNKYKNSVIGAKAIIQGVSDGRFDAGQFTNQILSECLLASKSQSEIAFEARKADDIKKIKASGLSGSDLGTYFAVKRLQQMGAIDAEVDKLIADAKNEISDAKIMDERNGYIKAQFDMLQGKIVSA